MKEKLRHALADIERLYQDAPIGLAILDRDLRFVRVNARLAEFNGVPIAEHIGRTVREVVPELADQAESIGRQIIATGEPALDLEFVGATRSEPGIERTWLEHWRPVKSEDGAVVGLSIVAEDVTERKRHEEHIAFLMREIAHRAKNLLAVVQALARQTAKQSDGMDDFQDQFGARLQALASMHNLLISQDWKGALVEEVVRAQIAPFAVPDQFTMEGPRVALDPKAAQHISLALHELATNAAKHGALSQPSGRVSVRWNVIDGETSRFEMVWSETGGPTPAERVSKGFGSAVIERLTPAALGGTANLSITPAGVTWTLTMPGTNLVPIDAAK